MSIQEQFKEQLGIDLENVLNQMKIPQEVYEKLVKMSIVSTQNSLSELEAAIRQKNWPSFKNITHDLIGVYANLYIFPLRDLVYKMRHSLDQGDPASQEPMIRQLFDEFSGRFEKLKVIFNSTPTI